MKTVLFLFLLTAGGGLAATGSIAPLISWDFEQDLALAGAGEPSVSGSGQGTITYAPGVRGRALVLDGQTTRLVRAAAQMPAVKDAFTVQAWVALGAYPLNAAPIVDLLDPIAGGFLFGIDAHGRVFLSVRAGDRLQSLLATSPLPLSQWQHVAGVLSPAGDLSVFLNNKLVAKQQLVGRFAPPPRTLDLLVGRARAKTRPEGTIRLEANAEIYPALDGALDEFKVYDRAVADDEIANEFNSARLPAESPVPLRVLPTGSPGAFGAFYARLQFYPQWDRTWRVGDFPDVVVRFGELPVRFVFWRGTSFVPNWVTESGIWYNNEFCETWGDVKGCGEPMSDKQTRFSHVRVIENTPARCVVHWRYALTDVFYDIARQDGETGWGDWADEIYTIYPDGTAVRDITLHSSQPAAPHEWQESIVVMGQGFSPSNSIESAGLTLVNDSGERADFSWEKATPPAHPEKPVHPVIQLVNTKSRYKPFAILRPQDSPTFDIFTGEIRREVSIYPWWNHWPAATFASDGRYAMAADRVSHSSLSHLVWNAYAAGPDRMRKIMLVGLTDQKAEALLPLARSWAKPPELIFTGEDYTGSGYDPAQKAYSLHSKKPGTKLTVLLAPSADSPIVNPAFVILGWGDQEAKFKVNGKAAEPGTALRVGHRQTIDSNDLIAWVRAESQTEFRLDIEATEEANLKSNEER